MNAILTLVLLISGPDIHVVAAPDQPIPHVYVDDPVIIEITAARDTACTVSVTVEPEAGEALEVPVGPVALRANSPYWHVLEGIPVSRGLHTVRVRIEGDGISTEEVTSFCRADRPVTDGPVPVVAYLRGGAPPYLTAAQGIPLQRVCVDANAPQAGDTLATARAEGLNVAVLLNLEQEPDAETALARLAESFGEATPFWIIDPAGSAPRFKDASETVRRAGTQPTVLLAVTGPETLHALLSGGAGRSLSGLAYRTEMPTAAALTAIRATAERAGYEGLRIHVVSGHGDGPASEGRQLVSQVVLSTAAGASWTALDMGSLYDGERFSKGYARVSAMAHQLAGAVYIGELALPAGVSGHVFRSGETWIIVTWSDSQQEVQLNVGAVADVVAKDGRNNPLPIAAPADGSLRVAVGPSITYLRGTGGSVFADAARATARREAKGFVSNEDFARLLPAELLATIRHIASDNVNKPERLEFLALLKAFPLIEQRWHAGTLPRSIAVPAMASLQRLMRHLSVLEDALGDPFVEPVMDILSRCREYCSKYLTNSGDASRSPERGEAVLDIVGRLTADAEALSAEGRVTEAGGVAALAEWRARSLQFAEKARPLSEPGSEQGVTVPTELPPSEGQPPDTADSAASGERSEPESDGEQGDASSTAPAKDSGKETPPDKTPEEPKPPKENSSEDKPAKEAPAKSPESPKDATESKDGEKIVHVVKRGDNPWALGQEYGVDHKDLYKWNGWKRGHILNVGDKVTIYKKK
jgi:LysM repeat protein